MGSALSVWHGSVASALLVACSACSTPDERDQSGPDSLGGAGAQAGNTSGGISASGTPVVATSGSGGFAVGSSGSSTSGGGGMTGASGATAGGVSSGGVAGGGEQNGGGVQGNDACPMIASEYASELEKQLECNPSAGSQCTNKVALAPGCECRVFIQPSDPFAIEHLSNVANGWFEADCSMPSCPAQCSTAAAGMCQADPKSPLGGRCITP
jgi:hypothetical protein